MITCGLVGRDWLSVTHCLNIIEDLIDSPHCGFDYYIMPLGKLKHFGNDGSFDEIPFCFPAYFIHSLSCRRFKL